MDGDCFLRQRLSVQPSYTPCQTNIPLDAVAHWLVVCQKLLPSEW